jgi:hypothetical protein
MAHWQANWMDQSRIRHHDNRSQWKTAKGIRPLKVEYPQSSTPKQANKDGRRKEREWGQRGQGLQWKNTE